MEIRRTRGVATIIAFPIRDASGNLVTDIVGVTPQIATWTEASSASPFDPWKFGDIAGGLASISQGSAYWSSLTATEMANDYIFYVASPTSGSGKRFDCLINCTSIASVTYVSTVTNVATVDQVRDLRTTVDPELTGVPSASSAPMDKLNWLFALARNQITQSSATQVLWNDAGTGTISTAVISDSGTLFTRNEWS